MKLFFRLSVKYLSMRACFLFLLLTFVSQSMAQGVNMTLLSNVNYQSLHNTNLNDIWGYVDEDGNEYALVGAVKGVSVVNITDPTNPQEVYWHPGGESIWRDLKTFGDYAYITTEASDGLLILDLSPLPGGGITQTVNYTGGSNPWQSAHNLYIDEFGFCYIFGANRGNGGVIILDLNSDPMNPLEVGVFDNWYVHDGYVRNNIMYLAHIYQGTISMVDVTDKSNPVLLGTATTPTNFAHNVWPSDDGNYVFTTDEVSGGFLGAFDVTDPANMVETDRFRSNPSLGTVPHNVHVLGDFLITSYYADGVTIHDISDPYNVIQVGYYDTYPGHSKNTIGCWGAYPFLPSGVILATDIENGLFILSADLVYAARIEGVVTDANTNSPINNVAVEIDGDVQTALTNFAGYYATGFVEAGTVDITYSRYAYETKVVATNLIAGQVIQQDVELIPLDAYIFKVKVLSHTGAALPNAQVRVEHLSAETVFELTTNGLGEADFTLFYHDEYEIVTGRWGWISQCATMDIDPTTGQITFQLQKGFYDDFSLDFGWATFGNATFGLWERAIPNGVDIGGGVNSNPNIDSPNDCGSFAFVTGNGGVADNVTDGTVTLISPVFDATDLTDPYVYYERWFFNFLGPNQPNDTLRILLSNGLQTVEIDQQGSDFDLLDTWLPVNKRILNYLTPTTTMQLFVTVTDVSPTLNVTEAGFDHFRVNEGPYLSLTEFESSSPKLHVYPNPFNEKVNITLPDEISNLVIFDVTGAVIKTVETIAQTSELDLGELKSGLYFIRWNDYVVKVIKQ
jgi:choice-of-anchor B domain-containing protein